MQKTKIEYADYTWNPIKMRCSPVSSGCMNCWHLRFAKRHAANPTFSQVDRSAYAGGTPVLSTTELQAPFQRQKPARIAVQFMGDLWQSSIPDQMIYDVWHVIQTARWHTFLLLTKRPERMAKLLAGLPSGLPHIWLGVSVEDQATADERIPLLLQTPAAVRWVSVEPCLGEIDLEQCKAVAWNPGVNLVVCGAETGPHKRPCQKGWINVLRYQCRSANVPFFGKVDSQGRKIMPRDFPREK